MSQYIRASKKVEIINRLLFKDETYKEIRNRCNDNTHYNFYNNLILNDNQLSYIERIPHLDSFFRDLDNIFILHFAYLFTLNEHYMMASDYVDYLDLGLSPEPGSEYYVAPFIKEIFSSVIKKKRIDIATEILSKSSMMLE